MAGISYKVVEAEQAVEIFNAKYKVNDSVVYVKQSNIRIPTKLRRAAVVMGEAGFCWVEGVKGFVSIKLIEPDNQK